MKESNYDKVRECLRQMKRLCIYLMFDKQQIVDKYIGYMLKELKTCTSNLIVVNNGLEIKRGAEILEEYADDIFYRPNIGFDAGGFKDALCNYLGWDKVYQYDELVLVNDSMFGPFRSMQSIFEDMASYLVDFWGLTKHGKRDNGISGYVFEHIQSFFLVIRKNMLHSVHFKEYWERMPYYKKFKDVVKEHEIKFTQYFFNLGYTYATLADTKVNDSINKENNYSQYATLSYELIKKRNFPFLKKQQIAENTLNIQTQENVRQAIEYIDKNTDYDVDLIWDNIIRTLNMTDLQRTLHLQYIVSEEGRGSDCADIAILVFVAHKESTEYVLEYLAELVQYYFVEVVAEEEELLVSYRKHGIECVNIGLKSAKSIIEKVSSFNLVCVLCDADVTTNIELSCTGKSYFYNIWSNLIKNRNYVTKIIRIFESESKLGFLTAPQPNFAGYFGSYGDGWNGQYEKVESILNNLEVDVPISESKPPFRITNVFWIRGCILRLACDIQLNDYQYLPYLWGFFAQSMGYYSGIVEHTDYAALDGVNMQYYLKIIVGMVKEKYGGFKNFSDMRKFIIQGSLQEYCRRFSRVLVYGAGGYARAYKQVIGEIEAYVVSDGMAKPDEIDKVPVKYLSEIELSEDCCFVLCVNEENQKEILLSLKEHGIKHYFCI